MASALHKDCLACRGAADGGAAYQTTILLSMLVAGTTTVGSIVLDLCAHHQKQTRDNAEKLRVEWNEDTE